MLYRIDLGSQWLNFVKSRDIAVLQEVKIWVERMDFSIHPAA